MRGGDHRRDPLLEAADILAGRVTPDARRIIEIIHRVNPTALDLPEVKARQRYALKSRLQSLLVARFRDDLRVEPAEHGIVLLRHRASGRDACHAKVVELEEEARSWVQLQLDVAGDDELDLADDSDDPDESDESDDSDALRLGRAALAEYDFPAAEDHFTRAFRQTRGGLAAAHALLELLVDHLGQDADALALEDRLDAEAAPAPEVRLLLALAAARCHDHARALRHLRGLSAARAADIWAWLAAGAAERGEVDEATRCLDELGARDPSHPELARMREDVARRRAQARQPLEEELQRCFAEGDLARAEAQAKALVARWPDCQPARRILERLDEQRREAEAARMLELAAAALEDGDLALAAGRLHAAQSLGAEAPALGERISRALAAEAQRRDEQRTADVLRLLEAGDEEPALTAYLALEPPLRARVRQRSARPLLEWAEETEPRHGGRVRAVLALARATEMLGAGEAEGALRLLEPHRAALEPVRHARATLMEAQRRLDERRRSAAELELEAATRAAAAGELEPAERRLRALDRRALGPEKRAAADELITEVRRRRARLVHEARVAEHVAAGDLLAAAAELDALGEAAEERRQELRAAIREAWRLRSVSCERAIERGTPLGELLREETNQDYAAVWLTAERDRLVVAEAYGPQVFVAVLRLHDRRVERLISFQAPQAVHDLAAGVDGDLLWLFGREGHAYEISWPTGEIRGAHDLRPFLGPGESLEKAFVVPGTRMAWLELLRDHEHIMFKVIDLDRRRLVRQLDKDATAVDLLVGVAEARVVAHHWNRRSALLTARGQVIEEIGRLRVNAVAPHPSGRGIVVVGFLPDDEEEGIFELFELQQPGLTRPRGQRLLGSNGNKTLSLVSALDDGMVFVLHHFDEGRELRAFQLREGHLVEAYRAPAPSMRLLQDAGSRRVVALVHGLEGLEIIRLGPEPPALPEVRALARRHVLPQLERPFLCRFAPENTLVGRADAAAREGRWSDVRALLETDEAMRETPPFAEHAHHLLGLAHVHAGDVERARAAWETGRRLGDPDAFMACELDACLELVAPLPEPTAERDWDARQPVATQLRGAIAVADRCLAAADLHGALAALRRPAVFRVTEVQSLARLAEVVLRHETDPWDTALLLARFLESLDLAARKGPMRQAHHLPLGEAAWDAGRIDEVARRARAWLAVS